MFDAQTKYYTKVAEQRQQKELSCSHQWRYSGHSHNDDCYECTKCGKMKFE